MRAKQFCVLTTTEFRGRFNASKMHFRTPFLRLRLLSLIGGGSVVVDLLFNVLPIVCELCVCLCFTIHDFASILILQSS